MRAEIVGWENERKLAAKLKMEKRKVIFNRMTNQSFIVYTLND